MWQKISWSKFIDECQGHKVVNETVDGIHTILEMSSGYIYQVCMSVHKKQEESPIRYVLNKCPKARCFDWSHCEYQVFPGKDLPGFKSGRTPLEAWQNAKDAISDLPT